MTTQIVLIRSKQYGIPCVVPPPTATAQIVIDKCRTVGAVIDYGDGEEFCVQLRDDIGPELWTESSLRRSLAVI